jgi:hypothetical protein
MKNKVTIIVVLAVAVLSSCKKDRSCECTTISSRVVFSPSNTTLTTYKKATKKQIETLCKSYISTSPYETLIVDCRLK